MGPGLTQLIRQCQARTASDGSVADMLRCGRNLADWLMAAPRDPEDPRLLSGWWGRRMPQEGTWDFAAGCGFGELTHSTE